VSRYQLGVDGPVTITPGEVADLIEPMARMWVDQVKANGATAEARAALDDWLRSLHASASAFRRSVADVGTGAGELRGERAERVDPDVVNGLPASVVAERLHLSQRTVTGLVGRGLVGRRVAGVWFIDPESVAAYEEMRSA
jgi:hypothetical protein